MRGCREYQAKVRNIGLLHPTVYTGDSIAVREG
jgi:hypothetical protein